MRARFAEECCRITRPLPEYQPELEYRCSPEEYRMGERESYSPNAYLCHCRHNCTNYDELVADLGKDSATDHVRYLTIRDKIHELLEKAGVPIEFW